MAVLGEFNLKNCLCNNANQDIGGWDTSNVTDMSYMFYVADIFNQDLSGWCVSNVYNWSGFDHGATDWTDPKPVWGTCP